MSYGPLAGMHFNMKQTAETPGVFWQTNKQKQDAKKFGYKTKKVRHPIRRPDEEEALQALEAAKEADKKRFNKNQKNFIQNNKNKLTHKGDQRTSQQPSGTEIKPGTVTLTQEQLAALLASLGKSQAKSGDNPMKISIDASTNKIEVEQYESDDDSPAPSYKDGHRNNNYDDDDDDDEDVGIAAFLNNDRESSKTKKSKPRERREDAQRHKEERTRSHEQQPKAGRSRDDGRAGKSRDRHSRPSSREQQQAKDTAATAPQPSREEPSSRLQPPRGGSEMRLSWEEAKKEAGVSNVPDVVPWKHLTVGERKRLQWARERAELAEDYNPWGRPGAGAPAKKEEDSNPRQQEQEQPSNKPAPFDVKKQREILSNEIEKLRQEIQEAEARKKKREEAEERERKNQEEQQSQEKKDERRREQSRPDRKDGRKKERKEVEAPRKDGRGRKKTETEDTEKSNEFKDTAQLSKKELERRQWLDELNKQREEQRMRKQQEKERDRQGIDDQWADRFVYHKSIEQVSPRHAHVNKVEEVPLLGKATEDVSSAFTPPVAMRSALVVGGGTLNEHRFDNAKALEKKKWLEELERQREEQRQARQAQKERDRADDGTWADHYPSDHLKLRQTNNILDKVGPSPRNTVAMATTSSIDDQRTSSAPGPATVTQAEEENSTFLRGQGVFVDPVTRKEQEEKRRVYLEYQAQIKAQIEEKERLKKEERERKRREDMEEERRLQQERDAFQNQLQQEQRRLRDKEEERQRKIDELKQAMDVAEERAQEEKHSRRLQHLKQKGHDVAHLKATYEDQPSARTVQMSRLGQYTTEAPQATPRRKTYNTSAIPGLEDLEPYMEPPTVPSPPPVIDPYLERPLRRGGGHPAATGQSYTKEPYVEDRVLTPSRFRNSLNMSGNPDSPRREFGTQTLELKDLQAILQSLPDEVQIEYKMKVEEALRDKERRHGGPPQPNRKVHAKSAEDPERHGRVRKPKGNPRLPAAGRRERKEEQAPEVEVKKTIKNGERPKWNQKQKRVVKKNSEKDPFYHQRKEEKEQRRAKRERQLQYLQELNKERIPALSKSPGRSRDVSPEGKQPAGVERGRQPQPRARPQPQRQTRDVSPNVLSLLHPEEELVTGRSSPPIPTVRHKTGNRAIDTERDPYHYANTHLRNSQTDTRYGDAVISPIGDGEFLPFMRTTEILDPSKADDPMAISRENSRMERARRAYRGTLNPASKGRRLDIYQDKDREAVTMKDSQDPMLNPGVVTEHPTARQDRILQQLSSLKQTLMDRQKELETNMSTEDEHKN